jgi:adenylate cyclase class IV
MLFDLIVKFLESMGYTTQASVKKTREVYWVGDFEIVIDHVANLGSCRNRIA